MKPVVQTESQTDFIWPCYVKRKKIGQMGPIYGWGPLCEVSLSLFTVELERCALDFISLISPISTGSFKFCDLQVRALATSILFSGLHFEFGHPEVLHEPVGVS